MELLPPWVSLDLGECLFDAGGVVRQEHPKLRQEMRRRRRRSRGREGDGWATLVVVDGRSGGVECDASVEPEGDALVVGGTACNGRQPTE